MSDEQLFSRMALALAIGLAVGTERGWQKRAAPEGSRVAGIRTFAILGMLGGLLGVLLPILGGLGIGLVFLVLGALLIAANLDRFLHSPDRDITTEAAALATTVLGMLAVQGSMIIAAAVATVMVALLDMKPRLHAMLERIEPTELKAAIELALLSVVVLPLLPDRGIGPGGAINPYVSWWLVVIVAAISFAAHAAVRIAGQRFGLLITGFFAGLVSSTALTVTLSRQAREADNPKAPLAAGIAVATCTMFVRLLILVGTVRGDLALRLAPSFLGAAVVCVAAAFILIRKVPPREGNAAMLQGPLDLTTALLFGILLTLITVLIHYARGYAGNAGVYAIAAIGGLADVDAISLSMAGAKGFPQSTVVLVILIAAFVNTAWKIALAGFFGTPRFAGMVAAVILPTLAVAALLTALSAFQ